MPAPAGLEEHSDQSRYWREMRAAYADLVRLVDHEMRLVLEALENRGWLDETLIICTTDHGDRLGDCGGWNKGKPEDGSVRTPWFVRLPGMVQAGVSHDAPVEAVDVAATIFDAVGLETPIEELLPTSPSRSWWQHCTTSGQSPRAYNYSESANWRMIANSTWKYVLNVGDGSERLHNRQQDPDDLCNLANLDDHIALICEFRLALAQHMAETLKAPDTRKAFKDRAMGQVVRNKLRDQTIHLPTKPVTDWS